MATNKRKNNASFGWMRDTRAIWFMPTIQKSVQSFLNNLAVQIGISNATAFQRVCFWCRWRDWCSESCCYTTPAAAVNADYLDIIAEIIPCVFVSHTFLVFHAWHFSSPPADIKICKWEQMYEKRALRVQKWTVEKKVAQVFGNPLWTIACYLLQILSL